MQGSLAHIFTDSALVLTLCFIGIVCGAVGLYISTKHPEPRSNKRVDTPRRRN